MKTNKTIWIDLDNSPHVLFFQPIIKELQKGGYNILITARDCFQVCELAKLHHLDFIKVGSHNGKHKLMKLVGTFHRALQLAPIIIREKPELAISHGSRAQILLAALLSMPKILIMDYEYIKMFPFVRFDSVLVPDIIPNSHVAKFNGTLCQYPGIKEDVYVPEFVPDSRIVDELQLNTQKIVAIVRPPATEAHYHNPRSEVLFDVVLTYLLNQESVQIVMLPRNKRQEKEIMSSKSNLIQPHKIVIPKQAVNGLNLIWHSDLVISGGGTMNREAAALGIPVYSIFQGKTGAVDQYLAQSNRLVFINGNDELGKIRLIKREPNHNTKNSFAAKDFIVEKIVALIENRI